MKKTGIFYGSTTGETAEIAKQIASLMGIDEKDVHNVAEVSPVKLGEYDNLIFGSSTWGDGELQEDWYDFVDGAAAMDLAGKTIAIFGVGSQDHADTFCDAVGILYDKFQNTGAKFIGEYPADGYEFEHSKAQKGDTMVGLVLDVNNAPEYTEFKLKQWTDILKNS